MNKNKIIFLIIVGTILFFTIILILLSKKEADTTGSQRVTGSFDIWIYNDSKNGLTNVLEDFKAFNPTYKNNQFNVVSFDSYEEYYLALASAISKWESPDMFVLNNNEKTSIFSDQALGISPEVLSPNDFRKKFKGIFADDLIVTYNQDDEVREFLAWVPVWYETLGVFYNRRYVRSTDLKNISALNNKIRSLKISEPDAVPFALGNGSTVKYASDILTQLFLYEEGVSWVKDLMWSKSKQALSSYLLYWDSSGDNNYDSRFVELSTTGKNNFDLFSKWETFIIAGYPRAIAIIKEKWYSKNLLLASPFPHYFSAGGKTLVNYNYFVINKQSDKKELASSILQYLITDRWAEKYLDEYPYYLPALLSLESSKLEEKISPDFNISLWDFYDPNFELWSFDKWVKIFYDREINNILDNSSNYITTFETLRRKLVCQSDKLTNLVNISNKCE